MSLDPSQIRRRHIPTKLQVEDRFDLGHGISFTWRQGGIVLAGLVVAWLAWRGLSVFLAWLHDSGSGWVSTIEASLGWVPIVAAALVILLFLAVAVVKIQGLYPESWFVVWITFQGFPKIYHWKPAESAGQSHQHSRGKGSKRKSALKSVPSDLDDEEDATS